MATKFIGFGAVAGFLSVALGAFAAHALKDKLDSYSLGVFRTAVEYQFYHAIALLFVGLWLDRADIPAVRWAGYWFLAGIVIFSGSLYMLTFTKVKVWGAVTPIGGLSFLGGWILLAVSAFRK